jgi:hypothetical protein
MITANSEDEIDSQRGISRDFDEAVRLGAVIHA